MNTKTMRLPPRRVLTTNKRKEEESGVDALQPSTLKKLKPASAPAPPPPPPQEAAGLSSHLLAGYLAHEYLTKGTLFGQPWDGGARAEATAEPKKRSRETEAEAEAVPRREKLQRYVEVADLMSGDGAQLAGVVNPSQLARLLQL
ncbi:hypothetical protein UlMin_031709 [Ulmus minor]